MMPKFAIYSRRNLVVFSWDSICYHCHADISLSIIFQRLEFMANIGKRKKQPPKVVSDQNSNSAKENEQGGSKKMNSNINVPKVTKNRTGSQRGR